MAFRRNTLNDWNPRTQKETSTGMVDYFSACTEHSLRGNISIYFVKKYGE